MKLLNKLKKVPKKIDKEDKNLDSEAIPQRTDWVTQVNKIKVKTKGAEILKIFKRVVTVFVVIYNKIFVEKILHFILLLLKRILLFISNSPIYLKFKESKAYEFVAAKLILLATFIEKKLPERIAAPLRRHFPLVLSIIFLTPAAVFIGFFIFMQLQKPSTYAATFTGAVKVSKQSTTLSTNGDWYTAMAYSGDGINGDAEAGTFNPIHPGGTTDGAAGALAVGYVAIGAHTTYATTQFIGFTPSAAGNLAGVQIIMENLVATSLSNPDIVVEILRFPSATCTSSCTNYVTGTQGAYTYPADTVVERRTVWQFNQGLSGENAQPGNFGRATFDFRFDPPLAVDPATASTKHYGIRIINMGATAAATTAFGVWGESPQLNGFPAVNGTMRTIGVTDIDATSATTMNMPVTLTGNSVLSGSASLLGGMVIGNSVAGAGMPTVRRTENEHWTATYSTSSSDWTIAGTVSGTQTNKLVTATDGGIGASWVNDGVANTTLTANSTATTVICVTSTTGFAVNQYIDIWDSDTATVQRVVASTSASHASCSNGPAIVTTANMVTGYTTSKNATVARSIWKQRIIQGSIQALSANTDATAVICVPDNTKFAVGGTLAIYDSNSAIITRTISSFAGTCGVGTPITVNSSPGAGTYATANGATVAEVSATLSNTGTPSNGDVMRWTSFNHPQNPAGSTLLARTTSVNLAYAKNQALSTSLVTYPFLSNRHIYFVAYGDANTTAPADGDMVIIGNGKADPDTSDSSNLTNDINWSTKQSHVVTVDRDWNAGLIYTGNYGAVGDGAGTRTNFSAYTQNGGWVSALITPGSQLGLDNSANKHYRITIPGKIVVDSDASLAFGKSGAALPSSSFVDIYFDNTSPAVSTTLTVDSAASATLTVTSTTGFAVGDTVIIDDNNSAATTRIIAAIENATTLTLTANAVTGYTTAQGAFVAKGPLTELPTGTDRRAGVYTMTGIVAASTQTNTRTGRVSLYGAGSSSFRTSKSDLATDIKGDIDTGFLGNNLTDAGQTWVDIKDDVVGNWQPLDQIAVAGGTNLQSDNFYSTTGLGGADDANIMPLWTGGVTAGGKNDLPNPNMEVAEIGTIPLTNIYNVDYNGGTPAYSGNYATTTGWTIFGDSANSEVNDAVYFGDQGSNMFYSLEFNIGTLMSASASYVWEYWNGTTWTAFTPRDAYIYQQRTGYTIPLSADTVRNAYTVSVPEGGGNFGLDQVVMIDDNDSSPIYRRLGSVAPTATTLTLSEPIDAGYTTAQSAFVSRLNGGRWISTDPTAVFTTNTGRKIISWTPSNLGGTPAKTTVNSINAYWVRARVSSFTSWTTSPANQTTPVGMSGIERVGSGAISVSSGIQEAKLGEVTTGASYNPNETWTIEYGNSPGWIETQRFTAAQSIPNAPYVWHISGGTLNVNATNLFNLLLLNGEGSLTATDYTVSGLVEMDMVPDANLRRVGLAIRQNLDGNGYAALITKTNAANTIAIYSTLSGVPTIIGSATTKAFTEDTLYCIKVQATGTTLNAKFWATSDCTSGEPGPWDVTQTSATYTAGRFGLYTGSATASQGMKAIFDDITTDTGFSDTFTDTGTYRVVGSIQGLIGSATPSTPFTSSYINFTIKNKGGLNGVTAPEIGDKIYLTATSTRSYIGLDSAIGITTTNANTKYEKWDFEWNPTLSKYNVTGSATGSDGTATPGTTYTSSNNEISLRIPSGTPTATKFGNKMLLLQDNLLRNNASWTGVNGMGSAVLIYPSYILTSSAIANRYNIEGLSGSASAQQRGTIDFWFKPNYSGSPANPKGAYLVDYANLGDADRLFIRHSPDGNLEIAIYAASAQGTMIKQSFNPTAGQWYHLRVGWDETANAKRAWLDGVPFSTGQASTVGTRGVNAGLVRIGNRFLYDAPFDGSIDEFAIFDDDIDTSAGCNWGSFTPPSVAWTGGETVTCVGSGLSGTNIFKASFDTDMNPQEGFMWADYAFGNPAMVFTNGADTGNERISVITYPESTRIWVDNTGDKYTPSARIKSGSGHLENAAIATLTGWSNNFTYHHKAKVDSEDNPTYSPVLNLRRSTHIWSDENFTYTGATAGAPINAGNAFGLVGVGLTGLATMSVSDISLENQYAGFSIMQNPYTSLASKPSQRISNSVFYNFYDRAYTVASKTEGTNYVGAYFVTTNFAAANIGNGYNVSLSQNVGLDGSIFMGNRNAYVTVPPVAANGAAAFISGRLYTITNSEFYNNGVAGIGTSGALNFSAGVAKVTISNNIFSINNYGIRLYGNSFFDMSDNVFDGHLASDVTTVGNEYGSGIRVTQTTSSIALTDDSSTFGRGIWNEADISTPPNTTTFEAESLAQFTGSETQFLSPVLFGTVGYQNMSRVPDQYLGTTIPGADIRGNYSSDAKDIVNSTTFGHMRTTGLGLADTTVHTSGGYAWRMDPTSADVTLDYTAKLVGVASKPLAATGYIRVNSAYGSSNLPVVTLSGLGMTGANLTWTASDLPDTWQQFVVSGTPTESALAELKISVKNNFTVSDSGTNEIIAAPIGNYLPPILEDSDKAWTPNQWVGYKLKDSNGKIFDIVRNTSQLLYLKGTTVPFLKSTTFAALTTGDYVIFDTPKVYLDDVSVLSGTVDTGTLDYFASGQPVSPWLSTGLTAEGVWSAQYSNFADTDGSFGQLLQDTLVAKYANVSDLSPTTTDFDTNLASTADDFYNNGVIIFTTGQNKGVVRRVSDYSNASKNLVLDPATPFTPANGDRFAILAATASASGGGGGASAADIWGYALRTLTDATLTSGSLATAADVAAIQANIASVITELGTGNIAAIKTKTDTIDWSNVTGLVTTSGAIKLKTDTIDWTNITDIKTKTDTIAWADVAAIKLKTDTIIWGDITDIKTDVGTLITEVGTGNISAIKTKTDSIIWGDITGIVTVTGAIKLKTDTIDWTNVTGIKTATDTIAWGDVTGIKLKTDTIAWGDITNLQSSINALNNISASDVWGYGSRTITGDVTLSSASSKAIWDNSCSILNTSGTVGKLVCDNLDVAVSTRSNLTANDVWNNATRTITNLESPALSALANSVWTNATRTLTAYGNDITAEQVWDTLTSSLTTIDSIGKLLVTNVDEQISTRASQSSLDAMAGNIATIMTEIGTGNISAIKTKTDTIDWTNVTGLVTTSGAIKLKTDTINWADVTGVKTKTDTISWGDVTGIKLSTDTIVWGDITTIKANVATLITEIGTGNIAAIKTKTDTIDWTNITGLVTTSGAIKLKTDTIDWANVTGIKTKTDTISWADVTGIKLKTDTIDWADVDTIATRVDTTVSSRASQASLDAHESAESTFRSQTTSTLSALTVDVGTVLGKLTTIESKIDSIQTLLDTVDTNIDTIDANLDSVKLTVEDTNIKVTAMQSVTNDILAKWDTYSATTIIGYLSALTTNVGTASDLTTADSIFGKLNYIKANGSGGGGGGTVDLIYTQTQTNFDKLLELQTELGLHGKSTTAYDEMIAIKDYVDSMESALSTLDTRTSSVVNSLTTVSEDLEAITADIGKVDPDAFTNLFEIKKTDIESLQNKIIELQAISDINRQLLEKSVNEPIVKVVMEWGSVIIKFIIVNPSTSTTQRIPFKAFLPKEVKQEYILDLGGLDINYDTTTEQYYVTAEITLQAGEAVTRSVEIKDVWIISEDEVASLRKQADELSQGLKSTSYYAQGITLKTDVNTRLDKIVRKQKDNNATPQDHILAFRENSEDMKAVQSNLEGLKQLVLDSGVGVNFLASVGGIQTFATWGIVLILIFGMGVLGVFYYSLWKKKMIEEVVQGKRSRKKILKELPTPMPYELPGFNFNWLKKIFIGLYMLSRDATRYIKNDLWISILTVFKRLAVTPKIIRLLVGIVVIIFAIGIGLWYLKPELFNKFKQNTNVGDSNEAHGVIPVVEAPVELSREDKIKEAVTVIMDDAKQKTEDVEFVEKIIGEGSPNQDGVNVVDTMAATETGLGDTTAVSPSDTAVIATATDAGTSTASGSSTGTDTATTTDQSVVDANTTPAINDEFKNTLIIKQTPTAWLNVRATPSTSGKILTKVYPGETYPYSELKSGWYKILLKDLTTGWVTAQYVQAN